MITGFRFREDKVLREQVSLVYRNYLPGIPGYLIVSLLAAIIMESVSDAQGVWLWFGASAFFSVITLLDWWRQRNHTGSPRSLAVRQVVMIFILGVVWGFFPLLFAEADSTPVMTTITAFTTGLVAAALVMQSPCLPVFVAFAVPTMVSLVSCLFLLGGPFYPVLGVAALLFLATMIWFGMNLERTISESIELRFKNLDLIERLQSAIDEVKQADRAKSLFLASASHDLRQPLHALGLFVEGLKNTLLTGQQSEILSQMNRASDAANDMLNTFLDFSKLDAGVVESEPRDFRVVELLTQLEQELAPAAESNGLVYRSRETSAVAYADPALVELILRNFISNAIRYTHSGGILVACRRASPNLLSLEVWDTGIGIDSSEFANIFREFHQLDNPERDRQKGFGLGLAISRRLSALMDAAIHVQSVPGKGSVFKLSLPASDKVIIEDIVLESSDRRFDNLHILVLDDEATIREAMQTLLTGWGCSCDQAGSGDEALSLVRNRKPDLLIVDYRLRENQTGRDAIALIRSQTGIHIPAIIITGDTAPERIREAHSADAILIHKPTSATRLREVMKALLHQ